MNTRQLRKDLRARRRRLGPCTLTTHSLLMARQATACRALQTSRRIAFYLANDGEMDPQPLIDRALHAGKRCYLPVLRNRPANALWFARYHPNEPLKRNRFGIPEPHHRHPHVTPPWGLDLIIVPLVAFDLSGNRLGMGGGYYDRTLAYKRHRVYWTAPKLIGLAHEFQRVDTLPTKRWDIPLDGVITERRYYRFK